MNILRRMSRSLTEVGPTLRMTLFRDEQRRRLTRPESRLAARGVWLAGGGRNIDGVGLVT